METGGVCIRSIMLYEFRRGVSAADCVRNVQGVFGQGALTRSTCHRWYRKFRDGDHDLRDKPRSGRPVELDDDELSRLVDEDPRRTSRELADRLQVSQSTVVRHLGRMGMVSRLDTWVPHRLSERNRRDRYAACMSLSARQGREDFLRRVVTGDEKWVVYDNVVRKRSWCRRGEEPRTTPKANIHAKKVMLCCWWDVKGVVHHEFLRHGQTLNSEVYCAQLQRLAAALREKRPALVHRHGVILHQDNARPHVSLATQRTLAELSWEIMDHPAYSPDLAPSDFHLFRSLQNFLNGKTFQNDEGALRAINAFFASKPEEFFRDGIYHLVQRWRMVIEKDGDYIVD